jgi:hypothetical protein
VRNFPDRLLDDITINKNNDQFWDDLSEFTARLRSDHHIVFADSENLAKFRNSEQNSVTCFAMMEPTLFQGFASVCIMGACLTESVMYRYWQNKVTFEPHPHIKPRFEKHPNGDLVTIYYAHDVSWSKRVRNREIEIDSDKFKTIDVDIERVNQLFSGEVSVFMANKDITDISPRISNSIQLPNSPHGLNDFQGCHNAAVFSALNPSTAHFSFLQDIAGLNPVETGDAIARQNTYQAAGRISIRDLANSDEKRVVVMDKTTADWLAIMLPGARIEKLPGADVLPEKKKQGGQPKIHKSDAARLAAFKTEKKESLRKQLVAVNQGVMALKSPETIAPYNRPIVSGDLPVITQFFAHKKSPLPMQTNEMSQGDFVDFLKELTPIEHAEKDANLLLSPAVFDPNLSSETSRGLENVTHLRNIWLDNDGDEDYGNGISPEDFAKCFPNLKMCIFNSYGNTATRQKYRIMIPTKQRMTKEIYKFVIAEIMSKLAMNRGYRNKKYFEKAEKDNRQHSYKFDGFDMSKFTPSSMFYLPSQAGAGTEHSYFRDFNTNGSEMDVERWIDKTVQDIRPAPVPAPSPAPVAPVINPNASAGMQTLRDALWSKSTTAITAKKGRQIVWALEEWKTVGEGNGNAGFFKLGAALRRAGCDRYEVQSELQSAVYDARAGSRDDRQKQIPGILSKLF